MAMLVCTLVVNSTGVPLNVEPAATAFRRSKERVTKRNNHLRCVPSYVGHYLNRKGALGLDGLLYNRSNWLQRTSVSCAALPTVTVSSHGLEKVAVDHEQHYRYYQSVPGLINVCVGVINLTAHAKTLLKVDQLLLLTLSAGNFPLMWMKTKRISLTGYRRFRLSLWAYTCIFGWYIYLWVDRHRRCCRDCLLYRVILPRQGKKHSGAMRGIGRSVQKKKKVLVAVSTRVAISVIFRKRQREDWSKSAASSVFYKH